MYPWETLRCWWLWLGVLGSTSEVLDSSGQGKHRDSSLLPACSVLCGDVQKVKNHQISKLEGTHGDHQAQLAVQQDQPKKIKPYAGHVQAGTQGRAQAQMMCMP